MLPKLLRTSSEAVDPTGHCHCSGTVFRPLGSGSYGGLEPRLRQLDRFWSMPDREWGVATVWLLVIGVVLLVAVVGVLIGLLVGRHQAASPATTQATHASLPTLGALQSGEGYLSAPANTGQVRYATWVLRPDRTFSGSLTGINYQIDGSDGDQSAVPQNINIPFTGYISGDQVSVTDQNASPVSGTITSKSLTLNGTTYTLSSQADYQSALDAASSLVNECVSYVNEHGGNGLDEPSHATRFSPSGLRAEASPG